MVPKVASTAILAALGTKARLERRQAYPCEPGDEFRFMAVRHPLDRLVSAWSFFLKREGASNELTHLGYKKGCEFGAFLNHALEIHDVNQHTRMQWLFAGPWPIDLLVKLENLSEGWERFRERSGVGPLDVRNKSGHAPWQDYYTPEMRRRAEAVFAADIVLWERAR